MVTVFDELTEIAETGGVGSVEKKITALKELHGTHGCGRSQTFSQGSFG